MNPYLETHWQDVHARLIIHICEQIQEKLPDDLVARAEEQVAVDEENGKRFRPDVKVLEPDELREPATAYGGDAVAEPKIVMLDPEVERWVKIADVGGRLITVIEVLSPTNKSEDGRAEYRRRQRGFISGGANLVEIDLLRKGQHVLWHPVSDVPKWAQTPYMVCVFRATQPEQREVYSFGLRERLLPFRVPLRPQDADVFLHLQPLVDRCFEMGRYWKLDYSQPLQPPLPAADAAWLDQVLRECGLRLQAGGGRKRKVVHP